MNEFDLLGVDGYIPVFEVEKVNSPMQKVIDGMAKPEKDDGYKFKQHIVKSCVTRVRSRNRKFPSIMIFLLFDDKEWVGQIMRHWR
jgi:hypothetical protein